MFKIFNKQLLNSLLELRAGAEAVSLPLALPWLDDSPRGDNHPVIVVPGFTAGDAGTYFLRRFLSSKGYKTHAWNLGRNLGPWMGYEQRLADRVKRISERHEQKVSLIGWSLGGLFSRHVAHQIPDHVRSVISLGSPIGLDLETQNLSPLVTRIADGILPDNLISFSSESQKFWKRTPPVPTTALYSMTDGAADWPLLCDPLECPQSENICVPGSHAGMTHNAFVFSVIAERLAQAEGQWKPYDASGIKGWFEKIPQPLRQLM